MSIASSSILSMMLDKQKLYLDKSTLQAREEEALCSISPCSKGAGVLEGKLKNFGLLSMTSIVQG